MPATEGPGSRLVPSVCQPGNARRNVRAKRRTPRARGTSAVEQWQWFPSIVSVEGSWYSGISVSPLQLSWCWSCTVRTDDDGASSLSSVAPCNRWTARACTCRAVTPQRVRGNQQADLLTAYEQILLTIDSPRGGNSPTPCRPPQQRRIPSSTVVLT
jgi:hypothetical protein